jgi:hypothetical protein
MSWKTNIPPLAKFFVVYQTPPWVNEEDFDVMEFIEKLKSMYLKTSRACCLYNLWHTKRISLKRWQTLNMIAVREFIDKHQEELFI